MSFPNVADLSSAQGAFDADAYARSGRQAVIIKTTEGVGYHFSKGDVWEVNAQRAGLVVGRYHFAGDSIHGVLHPPEIEAQFCLGHLGIHTPGRFAIVDLESPLHGPPLYGLSPSAFATWGGIFLDYLSAHGGWPGMAYSFSGAGVVQRLKAPYLRWYAAYPGPVAGDDVSLHQFTDNGSVAGVGRCDDSHCLVDLRAFAGVSPPPPPPPPPPPVLKRPFLGVTNG